MSCIRRCTLFKYVPFCPTFLVNTKHGQTTNDLEANDRGRVVNDAAEESSGNTESRL